MMQTRNLGRQELFIFDNFLRKLDGRMGLQKQKVNLFIDRCTTHIYLNLKMFKLNSFVPTVQANPSTRSRLDSYRKQLAHKAVVEIDSGSLENACEKKVTKLDCI